MAIMLCFLRGWNAQLEVWRLLSSEWVGFFAPVQICDQAIYNRIERADTWMYWCFEQVSAWLRTRLEPWEDRHLVPWATEILAADASTLDRLGRYLPWLRTLAVGTPDLLAGQISALFNIRRQQWTRVEWWPNARDNCKAHFLTLVEPVKAGALLLFDRGYLNFSFFDQLTARGIWWISRYGNRVTYEIVHVCYQGDGVLDAIVFLGPAEGVHTNAPVRLVQFWHQGKQYRYLTNVLDPQMLPLAEVVKLYARRWDIELAFRAIKDHLNLHHLWSAKPTVIQVQLWCCLILAQVYHALQVEIAGRAEVEVFEVSLDLLIRLTPGWLSRGLTPLDQALCFGRSLGLIRPSTRHRIEVPWIDPSWVTPPPPEAMVPRERYRHRSSGAKDERDEPLKGTRVRRKTVGEEKGPLPGVLCQGKPEEAKPLPVRLENEHEDTGTGPRVRLKQGKLYLLE
jgi:hypothetical protein